jgi:hypothetical protein
MLEKPIYNKVQLNCLLTSPKIRQDFIWLAETPEVGGQGGHVPPQVLGYQLTLFGPRGADYAHHITTGPPIFLDDTASLVSKFNLMLGKPIYNKVHLNWLIALLNVRQDSLKLVSSI